MKQNERLVESSNPTKSVIQNSLSNKDGIFAYFLDAEFDNRIITKSGLNNVYSYFVYDEDGLLKKAFALNMESPRDYIY